MFCFKCGQQIPDDALFCHKCGVKIDLDSSDSPVPASDDLDIENDEMEEQQIETKSIVCPNCGGQIKAEDGIDTYVCVFCGNKFVLDGMSEAAYESKTRVKEMEHIERIREKELENERDKRESKQIEKERDARNKRWMILLLAGCFAFLAIIFFAGFLSHCQKVDDLNNLCVEIEAAIEDEDYDQALLLTNRLRLNDGWSDDECEEWDEKREEYIRQIERAQEKSAKNPRLNAPIDSDECSEYDLDEIVEIFEDAGYKKVSTKNVDGGTKKQRQNQSVKKVTIAGDSNFSSSDKYPSNAKVVVYYYGD